MSIHAAPSTTGGTMANRPETDTTFFLAKLSLPVHTLMVRTAVECAGQVADTLSLETKETFGIKLAVEEAFCNAVEHFSGDINDDERIHVVFSIEGDSLVISIREKGIPFDLAQAERFTPGDLENADRPGLGSLLMHAAMDSVELFVHGRKGKEVRMTKKIRYGALPAGLVETKPVKRRKKRPTVKEPEIRLARFDELAEVCRLAWRCYGFTQEEFLYDLEALTKKIESGEFKSVIAIDPESGNIIGHAGFKYHDPLIKVPELGLAFVDPAYRSPQASMMMAGLLFDMAKSEGDKGIFDCSVTTHTFSQKNMQEAMGSKPCVLMLGIAASGMQAKELATSAQEKGSVVNHYYPIDRTHETVFIPPHHQEMVADIYRWMDMPRDFGVPDMEQPTGASSTSLFALPDELNVAFIIVHSVGAETVQEITEALQQCRSKRMDAVYLFLPATHQSAAYLVEQCEQLRFFFAGIMPHIHDGHDRVLMQSVNIALDMDAIRVYGDMSRQLKTYVMTEQQRVQGLR